MRSVGLMLLAACLLAVGCDTSDPTGPNPSLAGTYYMIRIGSDELPSDMGSYLPDQYSNDRVYIHLLDVSFRFGNGDTVWVSSEEVRTLWNGLLKQDLSCCTYRYAGLLTSYLEAGSSAMTYKVSGNKITIRARNGQEVYAGYINGDTLVLGDPAGAYSDQMGYFVPTGTPQVLPGAYVCVSGNFKHGVTGDNNLRPLSCADFNAKVGPVVFAEGSSADPVVQYSSGVWKVIMRDGANETLIWGRVVDSHTILVFAVNRYGSGEWSGYGRLLLKRQ